MVFRGRRQSPCHATILNLQPSPRIAEGLHISRSIDRTQGARRSGHPSDRPAGRSLPLTAQLAMVAKLTAVSPTMPVPNPANLPSQPCHRIPAKEQTQPSWQQMKLRSYLPPTRHVSRLLRLRRGDPSVSLARPGCLLSGPAPERPPRRLGPLSNSRRSFSSLMCRVSSVLPIGVLGEKVLLDPAGGSDQNRRPGHL